MMIATGIQAQGVMDVHSHIITCTLHMVKHLKLQDPQPLTPETMNMVFKRTTK